jgi:uncharacterized membrane protein
MQGAAPYGVSFDPMVDPRMGGVPVHSDIPAPAQIGEMIEKHDAEYEWFRYSKFALPFLLLILGAAVVLFCLTCWQANINLKRIRPGEPRAFSPDGPEDHGKEGGIKIHNRTVRLWGACFVIGSVVLIFLVMYLRPSPTLRKVLYFVLSLFLLTGSVLTIIGFALDAGDSDRAVRCRPRELGNVIGQHYCENYTKIHTATAAISLITGVFALCAFVVLIVAALKSGKEPPPEDFEGTFNAPRPVGVSQATKNLLLLLLFFAMAFAIILIVFSVLLHESRDVRYIDEVYGTRRFTNLEPGWPAKNTRLRMSASAAAVIVVLLCLIPFRSRVVAYVFAWALFFITPMVLFVFALDVRAVESARDLPCPVDWKCEFAAYNATIFFDIFLGFIILLYLVYEFVFRLAMDVTHAPRI